MNTLLSIKIRNGILAFLGLLFAVSVFFQLNQSSLGMWDETLMGRKPEEVRGLLLGKPRPIRSDEWLVFTPWAFSQAVQTPELPRANETVGAGDSPLLSNVPTSHFSSFFKPQFWGFLAFDPVTGLSWLWCCKTILLFAGLLLTFTILTRNHIGLSLLGSTWIYFSSFTQWWFSNVLSDVLLPFVWTFVGFAWLVQSKSRWMVAVSTLLLIVAATDFALAFYPPFQVPIGYLLVCLLLTFLFNSELVSDFSLHRPYKIAAIILAAIASISVFVSFLLDTLPTIQMMLQTSYPGQRIVTGGGFSFLRYFSGVFDGYLSDEFFPVDWGNICEASSFLLVWPVAVVRFFLLKPAPTRSKLELLPLMAFLLFTTGWVVFGASEFVATHTMLSLVPSNRMLSGLGIGSIYFTILSLSYLSNQRDWRPLFAIVLAVVLFFVFKSLEHQYWQFTGAMLPHWKLYIACLGAFALCMSIFFGWWPISAVAILAMVIVPNALVNPVNTGAAPLIDNPLVNTVREVLASDPDARWAVFGEHSYGQLVLSAGAKVINGVKYLPNMDVMRGLDPTGANKETYNRYAHIVLTPGDAGTAPIFTLIHADIYDIHVDPCGPEFGKLNVRYMVFSGTIPKTLPSCLQKVSMVGRSNRFVIGRRKAVP